MVYHSHGDLLAHLRRTGVLRTKRVEEAMASVDRALFVPGGLPAYADHPMPIGAGQTISAPHMHAEMLELLAPHLDVGSRALDVGSGSGYLTACLRQLVGDEGRVVAVEMHHSLVEHSRQALERWRPGILAEGSITLLEGNALEEGIADRWGPFNTIHVGAAAGDEGATQKLLSLLSPGGRMVAPCGAPDSIQVLKSFTKDESGSVMERDIEWVGFVPLVAPTHRPHKDSTHAAPASPPKAQKPVKTAKEP